MNFLSSCASENIFILLSEVNASLTSFKILDYKSFLFSEYESKCCYYLLTIGVSNVKI